MLIKEKNVKKNAGTKGREFTDAYFKTKGK